MKPKILLHFLLFISALFAFCHMAVLPVDNTKAQPKEIGENANKLLLNSKVTNNVTGTPVSKWIESYKREEDYLIKNDPLGYRNKLKYFDLIYINGDQILFPFGRVFDGVTPGSYWSIIGIVSNETISDIERYANLLDSVLVGIWPCRRVPSNSQNHNSDGSYYFEQSRILLFEPESVSLYIKIKSDLSFGTSQNRMRLWIDWVLRRIFDMFSHCQTKYHSLFKKDHFRKKEEWINTEDKNIERILKKERDIILQRNAVETKITGRTKTERKTSDEF